MLTKNQEKLIKSLQTKKGREKHGLCLVEGQKVIETAGKAVEYTFTKDDSNQFNKLITTETPQDIAGVARIPEWTIDNIEQSPTIIVLDGVQDPGNVGAILRLCLGFNASLVLIESADVTNPKVIRSSVGAMFQVPWMKVDRADAEKFITDLKRPIYRLEKTADAQSMNQEFEKEIILIAGSEGSGIKLKIKGTSITIPHDEKLESLNVGHALGIVLAKRN